MAHSEQLESRLCTGREALVEVPERASGRGVVCISAQSVSEIVENYMFCCAYGRQRERW